MKSITKQNFDKLVRVNNPCKKGIFYAFITWNGYDYSESAINPQTAKWLLFDTLSKPLTDKN